MDYFFEKFQKYIAKGLKPDDAFDRCMDEKKTELKTQSLERYYFKQQANVISEKLHYDPPFTAGPFLSSYEKAKALVDRENYMAISELINNKKELGDMSKLRRGALRFATDDDIVRYIDAHPEDAHFFEGLRLLTGQARVTHALSIAQPTDLTENLVTFGGEPIDDGYLDRLNMEMTEMNLKPDNEPTKDEDEMDTYLQLLNSSMADSAEDIKFGDLDYRIDYNNVSLKDDYYQMPKNTEGMTRDEKLRFEMLREIPEDIINKSPKDLTKDLEKGIHGLQSLISTMSTEFGVNLSQTTLFETLDERSRAKLLLKLSTVLPEEEFQRLKQPFYQNKMHKDIVEEKITKRIAHEERKVINKSPLDKLRTAFDEYKKR